MKINVGLVSTSAGKKPNDKQIKKAAQVLKAAGKAKADAVKDKLQSVIDQALALDSEAKQAAKVFDAQIDKLQGQIDRIKSKSASAYSKIDKKIEKLIPKINTLQDEYLLVGGKDLTTNFPSSLKDYFVGERKEADAQPVKKAKRPKSK